MRTARMGALALAGAIAMAAPAGADECRFENKTVVVTLSPDGAGEQIGDLDCRLPVLGKLVKNLCADHAPFAKHKFTFVVDNRCAAPVWVQVALKRDPNQELEFGDCQKGQPIDRKVDPGTQLITPCRSKWYLWGKRRVASYGVTARPGEVSIGAVELDPEIVIEDRGSALQHLFDIFKSVAGYVLAICFALLAYRASRQKRLGPTV